jgi:hypothetical protein
MEEARRAGASHGFGGHEIHGARVDEDADPPYSCRECHGHGCDEDASIGADAAGTEIFTGKSVAANDVYDHYCALVMDAAEILQAFSGTNAALNLTVYGEEITLG